MELFSFFLKNIKRDDKIYISYAKGKEKMKRKFIITITTALALSMMLGACASKRGEQKETNNEKTQETEEKKNDGLELESTKSLTYELADGGEIKVSVKTNSGLKLPLNPDDNDQFILAHNEKGEMNAFFIFMQEEGYLKMMDIIYQAGFEEETNETLVDEYNVSTYLYTEDSTKAAFFWLPKSGYGIMLASSEENEGSLEMLLENISFEVIKSEQSMSDPFNPPKETENTEVPSNLVDNPDIPEINFENNTENSNTVTSETGNDYWNASPEYEETYSCEYFKTYEGKDCNIGLYYEPDDQVLEAMRKIAADGNVDEISIYNNIQSSSVEINGHNLMVFKGESNGMFKYYVISEDGTEYMELSNIYGNELDGKTLGEVIGDFFK